MNNEYFDESGKCTDINGFDQYCLNKSMPNPIVNKELTLWTDNSKWFFDYEKLIWIEQK